MKKSFKIIAAIFIFSLFVFSQNKREELFLLHSLERPACDPIIMQLDNFAVELQENPDYHGYVIIKGGENPVDNILYQRAVIGHFKQRGVDENSFSIITTRLENNKTVQIETWISSDGTKPELQIADFDFNLPKDKSILFNQDTITLAKIDGKEIYIGGCEICCLHAFYLDFLAEFLEANPNAYAQLTIYNKTRKGADKLKKLILADAEKDNKNLIHRLKFKYGGENKWSSVELNELSDIEVWLILQKQK